MLKSCSTQVKWDLSGARVIRKGENLVEVLINPEVVKSSFKALGKSSDDTLNTMTATPQVWRVLLSRGYHRYRIISFPAFINIIKKKE